MSTITTTIMNAQTAAGPGAVMNVENYRTVNLTLTGASTPTGTIKFYVSDSETAPDVTQASSASNPWAYMAVVDMQSGSVIAGNTGVAFAGTGSTNVYTLNTNGVRWVGAQVTSYVAGTYTVLVRAHPTFAPIG